jgi:RNA ligase
MTTKLDDLFDRAGLEQTITDGYVRTQVHPTLPYRIYNYAEKTTFERAWTPITKQCRGLIVNDETGEVLARPFRKFMNADEPGAYVPSLDEPVVVSEKQDGSLAIGYPTPDGGYAIATRGSFASVQAQHATVLWQERYADEVKVPAGITPLWEIIFPANRIVVDNGDLDDLVLLGAVDIATGRSLNPEEAADATGWPGLITEVHAFRTLAEALAAPERDNREGYVVHFPVPDERVKIKHSRYIELHRIVTGMNERVVWEHLGAGKPLAELIEPLPDEFHAWVKGVAARLTTDARTIQARAEALFAEICRGLPEDWTRKDFALAAIERGKELQPWLFHLLDDRNPWPGIWRTLRPSGAVTMSGYTEEAA